MKTDRAKNVRKYYDPAVFLLAPLLLYYIFQGYYSTPFEEVFPTWQRQLYSCLIFELTAVFLSFLIGKVRIALWIEGGVALFFGVLDSYIFQFRGSYLAPWDIFSVRTALNVAGNFNFLPTLRMVVVSVLILLWMVLAGTCSLSLQEAFKKQLPRYVIALVFAAAFVASVAAARTERLDSKFLDMNVSLFDSERNRERDGAVLRMIHESRYVHVEKPEDYDAEKEAELIANYVSKPDAPQGELPDIIVIMDEAFSDLKVRGDFETNKDYMPFIHSLENGEKNTVTGILNTSVKGGNTPNTEFEFLTSDSMAFFPAGSTPYQQYLRREPDSMCSHLKQYGYRTVASHPYEAAGWNRPVAYPLLGFDELYFLDYYEQKDPVYVRDYISDDSFFQTLMDDIDARTEEGPVFSFNVTMQNHSSYDDPFDNLKMEIEAVNTEEITDKRMFRMNQYLSLVLLTDRALENLIRRLEQRERPTVLLFFGDHEPYDNVSYLITERNERLGVLQGDEDTWNRYKVPFILWANYDIEEEKDVEMSVNYLGGFLLDRIGIPLSNYQNFVKETEESYPVLSAIRTVDSDGNSFNTDTLLGDEILQAYQSMQYYELFDDEDSFR